MPWRRTVMTYLAQVEAYVPCKGLLQLQGVVIILTHVARKSPGAAKSCRRHRC
jgi:hypothetical protein